MEGANLQCVNNHYAKFEHIGINTIGVTDYKTRHPLSISDGKNVYIQHQSKMRKYLSNGHKMDSAHL